MATVYREFDVGAPVERVWAAVADVGAINRLITFLGEVTIDGDRRTCAVGDLGVLDETIVSIDENLRRVAYTIRESPLNFTHHHASMQVVPNDKGGTRFVWITDVTPDKAANDALPEMIDQAVKSIKEVLST